MNKINRKEHYLPGEIGKEEFENLVGNERDEAEKRRDLGALRLEDLEAELETVYEESRAIAKTIRQLSDERHNERKTLLKEHSSEGELRLKQREAGSEIEALDSEIKDLKGAYDRASSRMSRWRKLFSRPTAQVAKKGAELKKKRERLEKLGKKIGSLSQDSRSLGDNANFDLKVAESKMKALDMKSESLRRAIDEARKDSHYRPPKRTRHEDSRHGESA